MVEAQPIQIEQVLRNLVSNAEKYSEFGQPIDVTVRHADSQVEVEVGDRGIGFSAIDESKAFTPFYRSKEAEAVAAGVGIGLIVCKRIVESLGGVMRISHREGGGALACFSLPSINLVEEDGLPERTRRRSSVAMRPNKRARDRSVRQAQTADQADPEGGPRDGAPPNRDDDGTGHHEHDRIRSDTGSTGPATSRKGGREAAL